MFTKTTIRHNLRCQNHGGEISMKNRERGKQMSCVESYEFRTLDLTAGVNFIEWLGPRI